MCNLWNHRKQLVHRDAKRNINHRETLGSNKNEGLTSPMLNAINVNQNFSFEKTSYGSGAMQSREESCQKHLKWLNSRPSSRKDRHLYNLQAHNTAFSDQQENLGSARNLSERLGIDALRDALKAYYSKNYKLAHQYYELAASYGEVLALHNLGVMLLHGQGIAPDRGKAHKCFIICSSHGLAESMAELGYMYLYGVGVSIDYTKSRSWFMRSAEAGEIPYAEYNLAHIYLDGVGVPVNLELGSEYLYASANKKFIPAMYNLAVCYAEGRYDFPRSPKEACKLYEYITHFENHGSAQNNLGVLYVKGVALQNSNNEHAIELFRKAARQGISEALFNLGEAYSYGIGVPINVTNAVKYYYRAAKCGMNSAAEYVLGHIFLHGEGNKIKPNQAIALYWFEKAAKNGHIDAPTQVKKLKRQLGLAQQSSLNDTTQQKRLTRKVY